MDSQIVHESAECMNICCPARDTAWIFEGSWENLELYHDDITSENATESNEITRYRTILGTKKSSTFTQRKWDYKRTLLLTLKISKQLTFWCKFVALPSI